MQNNVKTKKNNKFWYRIFFAFITITIVILLFFLFRDIILEILRLTKVNDEAGLKDFMRQKGWLGYIGVVLIEALEMIVVFIPAEFIQIPAGLSFHFLIAILLCDLGVCIGASVIYFLVHVLNFNSDFIEKKQRRIKNLATKRKGKNTQLLMYFLFVTPIIPFGAICYYASSRKISYRRYILTCSTGVIPSIVTSIIMGTSLKYFIAENLPIWALVLVIVCLGAILFALMFFISRRYLFGGKSVKGTPNSIYTPIAGFIMGCYARLYTKPRYIEDDLYEKLGSIEGGKIYLANHISGNDIYHIYKYVDPDRPVVIFNKYYMRYKFVRFFIKRLGFVSKMMFYPDIETVKKMFKYAKDDTSILMFPEARLSIDGTNYPLTNGTANLVKKLGLTVVLIEVSGNYLACSKVRKSNRRVQTEVRIKRIIEKDELSSLSIDNLDDIIKDGIKHNEFDYAQNIDIKATNKALNYDKVLYRCPKCGSLYKMRANGNALECECGFKLEIDNHFRFNDNEYGFNNIHDYYEYLKLEEKKYIASCTKEIISQEVEVKKVSFVNKKYDKFGKGVCKLTKDGFSFEGVIDNEVIHFSYDLNALQALPFSVNLEYECYYNNELLYFYPLGDKTSVTRFALLYDFLQETRIDVID